MPGGRRLTGVFVVWVAFGGWVTGGFRTVNIHAFGRHVWAARVAEKVPVFWGGRNWRQILAEDRWVLELRHLWVVQYVGVC